MAKRQKEEDPDTMTGTAVTVQPPPANGDSEPAKKPPRDKAEAFKRVGNQRLQKAIYAMRRLLPLANRNAYTYTDVQAETMKNVAAALAKEVADAFSTVEAKDEPPASFF